MMEQAFVTPLNSSHIFRKSVFDVIDSSQKGDEIIANYFVVRNDQSGIGLLQKLLQASQRGVKIILIVDSYGSLHPGDKGTEYDAKPFEIEHLNFLESNGIKTFIYRHILSTNFLNPRNIVDWDNYSRRNHNKNFIFNLKSHKKLGLVIGDSQWATEHFDIYKGNNVLIESERIYKQALSYTEKLLNSDQLTRPFDITAAQKIIPFHPKYEKRTYYNSSWYNPISIKENKLKFVYNDIKFKSGIFRKTIQDYEISLMNRAKNEIIYSTPYFCPDYELQNTFIKNHSKLKILIGKFFKEPFLSYGTERAATKLLRHNVKMYEYSGDGNIHYKDLICDQTSFIKTANGDGRSRFFNLETGVIIHNENFTKFNIRNVLDDLKISKILGKKTLYTQEPFYKRLVKKALAPFYYHHL